MLELSPQVQKNLDFARANLKNNIYDQAVLEGVATSFPQTEEIIDNGIVNGVSANDVQKIFFYSVFYILKLFFQYQNIYFDIHFKYI